MNFLKEIPFWFLHNKLLNFFKDLYRYFRIVFLKFFSKVLLGSFKVVYNSSGVTSGCSRWVFFLEFVTLEVHLQEAMEEPPAHSYLGILHENIREFQMTPLGIYTDNPLGIPKEIWPRIDTEMHPMMLLGNKPVITSRVPQNIPSHVSSDVLARIKKSRISNKSIQRICSLEHV